MSHGNEQLRRRIALSAGPYNLPGGTVPEIDGTPIEPWSPEAAWTRLQRVAPKVPVPTSGARLIGGDSNDVWEIGGTILRVCWRGDRSRLEREAALSAAIGTLLPVPQIHGAGRDGSVSWMVSDRVPGRSLAGRWPGLDDRARRTLVLQVAEALSALHGWDAPAPIRDLLAAGDGEGSGLDIVGRSVVPDRLGPVLDLAASMPRVDGELVERIAALVASRPEPARPDRPTVLHGDLGPGNVLVQDGRISGLIDWEWACLGRPERDVFPIVNWIGRQPPESGAERMLEWLQEGYPGLFASPGGDDRMWLYEVAYNVRCLVAWPPYEDREADLVPEHPLRRLRMLAEDSRVA